MNTPLQIATKVALALPVVSEAVSLKLPHLLKAAEPAV
jgi:hypothetical protein